MIVNTASFRKQHQALLAVAAEMTELMPDAPAAKGNAAELRKLLSKLAGQLNVHLAMEDETLYPRLIAHGDPRVSRLARRYMDEMGGLAAAFKAYCDKFPSQFEIERDPTGFRRDSLGVFDALGKRILREDSELYARVDALNKEP